MLRIKNYEQAEQYLLKALQEENKKERKAIAYKYLGVMYDAQKKYDKAEQMYKKAIENGDAVAYNNLGAIYLNQGKFDKAESMFLKALQNGDTEAYYNLGVLYYNQKRYVNAKRYFKTAVEKGIEEAKEYYYKLISEGY